MNLQRVAILFVTLLVLWLAACAAPPVASIQPMLIAAPPNDIRPSVTPLPTAQPPAQFIRPPGSPTPTGFVILSGPTLAPEVLAAFNAVPVSPTPVLANLNPTAAPTQDATLPAPSPTPTALLAAGSPSPAPTASITPTAVLAVISPTAPPTQIAFSPSPTTTRAVAQASPTPLPSATATRAVAQASPTPLPSATATRAVAQSSPTPLPSATATRAVAQSSPTPLPSATATRAVAVITPTIPAGWQFQQGRITAPVLLYHRIQAPLDPTRQSPRYSVPPETFEAQLKAFKEWGYTSITISQLAEAIRNGAPLPPRPIVFTFDDGYINVYENAFPLMKKYGFVGVFYIIGQNFNDPDFVNAAQLQEMAAAGWEIGSHSMTHSHLPQNHDTLNLEVLESKRRIEAFTGVPVRSFAYPFGEFDEKVVSKVAAYYTSAVALGPFYENGPAHLYAIRRIEIRYEYSLDDIAAMLPWNTPP